MKDTQRWSRTFFLKALWFFVLSLTYACAQTPPTQPLFPKYLVMGVVYAPPGSSSFVTYGSTQFVGSSNTISNSTSSTIVNTSSFSAGATLGLFGASIDYDLSDGWTTTSQNSNSVAVQTTTGNSISTMGPISSSLGVNHDNDIIYIWLNPVASGTGTPGTNPPTITWTNLSSNSCDLTDTYDTLTFYQNMSGCDPNQYPYPDIVGIPVWCLKNPYWPGRGCAQWLPYTSRSWDLSYWGPQPTNQNGAALPSIAPGLTLQDYADILQADPFVTMNGNSFNVCHSFYNTYGPNMDPNDPETINPQPGAEPTLARIPSSCVPAPNNSSIQMTRFQPYGTVEYPEPGPNGLPTTYSGTFQYSQTNTQGAEAIDTHTSTSSYFTTASFGDSFFGIGFSAAASYGSSNTSTWQQQNSTTSTAGTTASASYSITGPQLSDNYTGPATYNVYLDNVYGTFAFYSSLDPKVNLGYIAITTLLSQSGYCPGATEPSLTFPSEPVTTPPTASPVQTVYLTNCSPYPLTMVWPAVSFSDPGLQIANDGKDYCSNQVIAASNGGSGGFACSVDVVFAPVASDAPNTIYGANHSISATMVAAGTENASTYQNILVTNPATVSAVAVVGTSTTTTGATLLPTGACLPAGSCQPQDAKEPNVVTFGSPATDVAQTQQFTFTNYYSSDVNFYPGYDGINPSNGLDFTILTNTCYSQTGIVIVHSLGTCTFTLQYLPVQDDVNTQQSGILSTTITALATVGDLPGPGVAMATAGAAAPAALTLTPSPVTFNVTGTPGNILGWYTPLTLKNNTNFTVSGLTGQNGAFGDYLNNFQAANCPAQLLKGASCTVEVYTLDWGSPHNGTFYGTISVNGTLSNGAGVAATINATANVSVTGTIGANIVVTGAEQSGTEQVPATYAKGSVTINPPNARAANQGALTITIGAFTASASYPAGATNLAVAQALVAALNAVGSPVSATAVGSIITIKSTVAGSAGNLTLEATGDGNFQLLASGAALTGGKDATTKTVYDGGTVDVTTAGITASAKWGKKSTPQSIAKGLAASINKLAGTYWKASASAGVVTLTPVPQTPPSLAVSVIDSKGFTPASFVAATN